MACILDVIHMNVPRLPSTCMQMNLSESFACYQKFQEKIIQIGFKLVFSRERFQFFGEFINLLRILSQIFQNVGRAPSKTLKNKKK